MKLFETVTKHFAWYTDVLMSCILMKWPFDGREYLTTLKMVPKTGA